MPPTDEQFQRVNFQRPCSQCGTDTVHGFRNNSQGISLYCLVCGDVSRTISHKEAWARVKEFMRTVDGDEQV